MKVIIWFVIWFMLFMGATHVFALETRSDSLYLSQACLSGGLECQGLSFITQPQVIVNTGMQPFGMGAEDDYTPAAALEQTGYYNPQVTLNGMFIQ